MTYLAALPLAAVFALGMASGAQAWGVVPSDFKAEVMDTANGVFDSTYGQAAYDTYDRCHGRSAGTASRSCGTATGGPSGGLH